MPEKLMIIDGNSIVNRAFYGVPLLPILRGIIQTAFTDS